MSNLYVLLGLVAGAGVTIQAVLNSRLRVSLGSPFWAATTQFVVGLASIILVAVLTRQPAPVTSGLSRLPWFLWTGGIFGATFIFSSIVLTPKLGAALMITSTIVGQLTIAIVLDHYGWLGVAVVPLSMTRVLGAVFLLLGVMLMSWK